MTPWTIAHQAPCPWDFPGNWRAKSHQLRACLGPPLLWTLGTAFLQFILILWCCDYLLRLGGIRKAEEKKGASGFPWKALGWPHPLSICDAGSYQEGQGSQESANSPRLFKPNIFLGFSCLFMAVPRLSLVVVSGGYSLLRCMGSSFQRLLLLSSMGSAACGLRSWGVRA